MFESAANILKLENKPQVIKMIFQLAQRMLYFSCETCVLIVANRNFSNEITKLCKTVCNKQCPGNGKNVLNIYKMRFVLQMMAGGTKQKW